MPRRRTDHQGLAEPPCTRVAAKPWGPSGDGVPDQRVSSVLVGVRVRCQVGAFLVILYQMGRKKERPHWEVIWLFDAKFAFPQDNGLVVKLKLGSGGRLKRDGQTGVILSLRDGRFPAIAHSPSPPPSPVTARGESRAASRPE